MMSNDLVQINDPSRREILRKIALGLTAAGMGTMDPAAAQEVHKHVSEEKASQGGYTPKAFTDHEYATITRLAELIVPADEKGPSAVDAGAPEFIDLLSSQNEELADIYRGGILWLDARMRRTAGSTFLDSSAGEQSAVLDALVEAEQSRQGGPTSYRGMRRWRSSGAEGEEGGDTPFTLAQVAPGRPYRRFMGYGARERDDLGAGIKFFDWVRKLSVDAYYTSPEGYKDVGYLGNIGMPEYKISQDAFMYAWNRSPFRKG